MHSAFTGICYDEKLDAFRPQTAMILYHHEFVNKPCPVGHEEEVKGTIEKQYSDLFDLSNRNGNSK